MPRQRFIDRHVDVERRPAAPSVCRATELTRKKVGRAPGRSGGARCHVRLTTRGALSRPRPERFAAGGGDADGGPCGLVEESDGGVAYGFEAGEAVGDLGAEVGFGGSRFLVWDVDIFYNQLANAVTNVTIGKGPGSFPLAGFVPAQLRVIEVGGL